MVVISEQGLAGSKEGGGGAVAAAAAGWAGAGAGVALVALLLYARRRGWRWAPAAASAVRNFSSCCEEACPPLPPHDAHARMPPPVAPRARELVKAYSFDGGDSSSESEAGPLPLSGIGIGPGGEPPIPPGPMRPCTPAAPPASGASSRRHTDPASLAEKGRAGLSSDGSCCSSAASSVGGIDHGGRKDGGSDLRETKIDNQGIDYQQGETSACCAPMDQPDINCNRDCIVVMNNVEAAMGILEPVPPPPPASLLPDGGAHFDGVDGERPGAPPQPRGHLEIALLYDAPMRKMTVHVLQARGVPAKAERGQPLHTQVRLLLLPSKKQKHKTKIRSGEHPQFMESFLLHRVNPEDVNSMGIRLRLYGCERMRRERLIGETVVSFANINLELENNFWLALEPRSNASLSSCGADLMSLARSDSTGSTHSMQHGGVPELLLGLCYNATTGRLNVEVVKGSHFRNLSANRAPDTYVKLNLVSSTGQELAHSKTTVRRGQPNPLFKETFVFQVALFQLADVTLMVVVYNRRGVAKKKEMVGWFSLGLNSSGAEELAHWMDMKEFQQEQVLRWHILVHS